MQLIPNTADMTVDDWRPLWTFQTASKNARNLRDHETRSVDDPAEQLIAEFLPAIQTSEDEKPDDESYMERCMNMEIVSRPVPHYPREAAWAWQPGWSHFYLLIDSNRAVVDAVPIAGTHHRFDRATRKAVDKWRFKATVDPNHQGDCDSTVAAQTIDFQMNDSGS